MRSWQKARKFLWVFWCGSIVATFFLCLFSLERRYEDQKTWSHHVAFLQKRFSEWKSFYRKKPLKPPSLNVIKKLEALPLFSERIATLEEVDSHPLLIDPQAVKQRLVELQNNRMAFEELGPRHFSLKKPVQLGASDLEKMMQILENENTPAPIEILGIKFEKVYDHLEGEVFTLSELDIVL